VERRADITAKLFDGETPELVRNPDHFLSLALKLAKQVHVEIYVVEK
jgi:hypothetical protein